MPDQDKKLKSTEKATDQKSHGISMRDYSDLKRLQSLLNAPSSKQQLSGVHFENGQIGITRSPQNVRSDRQELHHQWQESTETVELENFSVTYKNERNFSKHPKHKLFQDIFTALVKNRLNSREWVNQAPSIHFLRVLICLRLLIRDPCYQEMLYSLGGIENLVQYMEAVANGYLDCGEEKHNVDKLVNMTYILQKIAAVKNQREWVIASGAHKTLVNLLSARDSNVLLGALLALISLAESPECREKISELTIVENLLVILHEYDLLSKRLTAELLRLLCAESQVREQVKIYEGIPVLLSLLHSDHIKLLWSVVWILVQVCEDPETSVEIRIWGGIKQLLHILQGERSLVSDRSSVGSLSSANAAGRIQHLRLSDNLSLDELQENTFSLQAACCAAITELVLNDTNAYQVVQANGIYIIAKLILPDKERNAEKAYLLQSYAFRALRFLFSMERNRHIFKRIFPTDLFEIFIDIGHYVRDIGAYEELVSKLNLLKENELKQIAESIESVNQNKAPTKHIGNYAILDHLGSGAFGSVYKVRKHNGQNLLAMKEVNLHNPAFGKDKKDRDSSVQNIVSELTIIKEQLYHPNVVRYYRTFLENDRLYIVMELIDGVPLGEHFHSLKEKQQQFTEERIWNIFIQLCLALRYLHKEKRIVHRDLTPNNVMLGDKDKVKITDFGLAKQKQENSKLASVVGTILYSCPEVVKSEPYGEKADVWAAGCILYQMATLNPPFYSTNMLSLATKIVGAVYEPVPEGQYSEKVSFTIKRCLTPDAETRPDIVEVSSLLSDVMMKYLDVLSTSHLMLEKKLDRERRRTQRYFTEANRNAVACQHQLSILPQKHYYKLRLQGSTSGTASCKSDFSENVDVLAENCQSTCRKDEKRTYEEILVEDNSSLENSEKDLFSELDDELDVLDNSSSSSSSHLRESAFGIVKKSLGTSERQPQIRDCIEGLGSRLRPGINSKDAKYHRIGTSEKASAGIAVSQRKVRQISDPVQQILIQLHKIIFITQLPPPLQCNLKRRIIERFKKSLFSQQSNPCNLKLEMKKLLQGSPELIDTNFFTADWHVVLLSSDGNMLVPEDRKGIVGTSDIAEGMTYEQLQTLIEEVLEESGYYNFSSNWYFYYPTKSYPAKKENSQF
ncbi:serine/threonine-protein kinase Nek10 isoform X1 [Numida meleagris]|uniref:serine/threonine-protein kinase Nek10 isoform X1 n=1 Tax=Numida meleagris TaxID=8996 RepID=UPI000B3DEEA5|nr:serine/threonine-protein kinase Nek10 isoform X1 [Numida meleagris]XP_021244510.1 serine/threonine-protein kinase Nek10 isoform X1 [Numida meleagris]XP_021244511.1 serine/threonine-protein kinase Nek10 isoform X1 [Numida meleagris]XP_021244512.1 serine/threonine-protein kinase Nek10 isoform X1 [Numida meleagris]